MKIYINIMIISAFAGGLICYKFFPRTVDKVVTNTETKIKTVTKEIVRPNGEIVREIVQDSSNKIEVKLKPQYNIGIQRQLDGAYGITAGRRIVGDVFGNVSIDQKGRVGVGISIEF